MKGGRKCQEGKDGGQQGDYLEIEGLGDEELCWDLKMRGQGTRGGEGGVVLKEKVSHRLTLSQRGARRAWLSGEGSLRRV